MEGMPKNLHEAAGRARTREYEAGDGGELDAAEVERRFMRRLEDEFLLGAVSLGETMKRAEDAGLTEKQREALRLKSLDMTELTDLLEVKEQEAAELASVSALNSGAGSAYMGRGNLGALAGGLMLLASSLQLLGSIEADDHVELIEKEMERRKQEDAAGGSPHELWQPEA